MTYQDSNIEFKPKPTDPRFIDIEGQTFNRLTVIGYAGKPSSNTLWYCRCICGGVARTSGYELRKGLTKSCGCWDSEVTARRNFRHGGCGTPEYRTWLNMRNRCFNPRSQDYINYGNRGITVCNRWDAFENFREDMGSKPSSEHSLERLDNDGNYEPDNCAWALQITQTNNKRNNHRLIYLGQTHTIAEWGRLLNNIPESTIRKRLKLGWSTEDALTRPLRHINSPQPYESQTKKQAVR